MRTEHELQSMTREQLIDYARSLQLQADLLRNEVRKNERLNELLKAVGIVYETYSRESL